MNTALSSSLLPAALTGVVFAAGGWLVFFLTGAPVPLNLDPQTFLAILFVWAAGTLPWS